MNPQAQSGYYADTAKLHQQSKDFAANKHGYEKWADVPKDRIESLIDDVSFFYQLAIDAVRSVQGQSHLPESKGEESKEEATKFLQWCKNERIAFSSGMLHEFDWYELTPKQRVVAENFMIAFDQLIDRHETNVSPRTYTREDMLAYGERIKVEAAEKARRGNSGAVMQSILSIDHEALIEKK